MVTLTPAISQLGTPKEPESPDEGQYRPADGHAELLDGEGEAEERPSVQVQVTGKRVEFHQQEEGSLDAIRDLVERKHDAGRVDPEAKKKRHDLATSRKPSFSRATIMRSPG